MGRYLANPSQWEACLSGPRYLGLWLCHHKDLPVQRGREQILSLKLKDSTSPTLFWLSLCFSPAYRIGWAWLFMCVHDEIAVSLLSFMEETEREREEAEHGALSSRSASSIEVNLNKPNRPVPLPQHEKQFIALTAGSWRAADTKLSLCFLASQLKHSATVLEVWTGSESLLTYKEFPWPWLF